MRIIDYLFVRIGNIEIFYPIFLITIFFTFLEGIVVGLMMTVLLSFTILLKHFEFSEIKIKQNNYWKKIN